MNITICLESRPLILQGNCLLICYNIFLGGPLLTSTETMSEWFIPLERVTPISCRISYNKGKSANKDFLWLTLLWVWKKKRVYPYTSCLTLGLGHSSEVISKFMTTQQVKQSSITGKTCWTKKNPCEGSYGRIVLWFIKVPLWVSIVWTLEFSVIGISSP